MNDFSMNDYAVTNEQLIILHDTAKPKWKATVKRTGIQYTSPTAPNWLHRKAQALILGIVWERIG